MTGAGRRPAAALACLLLMCVAVALGSKALREATEARDLPGGNERVVATQDALSEVGARAAALDLLALYGSAAMYDRRHGPSTSRR